MNARHFLARDSFLFHKLLNVASNYYLDKATDKITSKVLPSPKNAYLRWASNVFNSTLGDYSMEFLGRGPNTMFKGSQ